MKEEQYWTPTGFDLSRPICSEFLETFLRTTRCCASYQLKKMMSAGELQHTLSKPLVRVWLLCHLSNLCWWQYSRKRCLLFFHYQLLADPIPEICIEFSEVSTVYSAMFKLSVRRAPIGYIFLNILFSLIGAPSATVHIRLPRLRNNASVCFLGYISRILCCYFVNSESRNQLLTVQCNLNYQLCNASDNLFICNSISNVLAELCLLHFQPLMLSPLQ